MTLDGITRGALVRELQCLQDAKIEKIYQPEREELVFLLHTSLGKKRLLLSAAGGDCRLHLTETVKPNPDKAPNFCMLLRKYLTGGRIQTVRQLGLERVVHLGISAKDEMGIPVTFTLVAEIMGKYSNIILMGENGRILDSIRRVSFDVSRVRQVLPGMAYEAPPLLKHNPLEGSLVSLADVLKNGRVPECLVKRIEGMSYPAAEEVVWRAFGERIPDCLGERDAMTLAEEVRCFVKEAVEHPQPCLQRNMDGLPVFYSPLPFHAYPKEGRMSFAQVNEMLDSFYAQRSFLATLNSRKNALAKELKKHRARVEKKLKIQLETLAAAEKSDKYQLYGELLTANIHLVKRGQTEVEVTNYYTGHPIRIPLEPALSPSANAAKYFKRLNKLKNAAGIAKKQKETYEAELSYIESLEYTLTAAEQLEEVQEVKLDMIKYGYYPDTPQKKKIRREDPLAQPKQFRSSDGATILAGRNGRSNDALTLHLAGDQDIWFHARNMPGSHVILFTKGKQPTETAIWEAAVVAATLSKGKHAGKVEVDYTPRANVWKAKGARPGMVLYEGHQSITVAPDESLLHRLERKVTTESSENAKE